MSPLALALTGVVALLHVGFLVLEMFLWDHPVGRRVFRLDADFAARSAGLAANQGLYNGFLAAGLGWSMLRDEVHLAAFFLTCVIIAGVYGGVTVKQSILWIQALPAAVALAAAVMG